MHHSVFKQFSCWEGHVDAGIAIDFLGTRTRQAFDIGVIPGLQPSKARKLKTTYPAQDNEEYLEWIALLESVSSTESEFTMIELGAGYGRWLMRAASACQSLNKTFKLIGVEADPDHFAWMKLNFKDNGIDPEYHHLIEAAISGKKGHVLFRTGRSDEWYGQAIYRPPSFGKKIITKLLSLSHLRKLPPETLKRVKSITLNELLESLNHVDFIDMDVQGTEFDILRPSAELLDRKVKTVFIGTHGLDIEHGLRELFTSLKWDNIFDYSNRSYCSTPWAKIKFQDGVQAWTNPRL